MSLGGGGMQNFLLFTWAHGNLKCLSVNLTVFASAILDIVWYQRMHVDIRN